MDDPNIPSDVDYVFFDVETTTGRNPVDIIEFAAVILDKDGLYEKKSYSTLIHSAEERVSSRSVSINHITTKMLRDAPPFEDVAGQIYSMLDGLIWCGHNIKMPVAKSVLDTYPACSKMMGKRAGNLKLNTLGMYFGYGMEKHRAIHDVRLNIDVFKSVCMAKFLDDRRKDAASSVTSSKTTETLAVAATTTATPLTTAAATNGKVKMVTPTPVRPVPIPQPVSPPAHEIFLPSQMMSSSPEDLPPVWPPKEDDIRQKQSSSSSSAAPIAVPKKQQQLNAPTQRNPQPVVLAPSPTAQEQPSTQQHKKTTAAAKKDSWFREPPNDPTASSSSEKVISKAIQGTKHVWLFYEVSKNQSPMFAPVRLIRWKDGSNRRVFVGLDTSMAEPQLKEYFMDRVHNVQSGRPNDSTAKFVEILNHLAPEKSPYKYIFKGGQKTLGGAQPPAHGKRHTRPQSPAKNKQQQQQANNNASRQRSNSRNSRQRSNSRSPVRTGSGNSSSSSSSGKQRTSGGRRSRPASPAAAARGGGGGGGGNQKRNQGARGGNKKKHNQSHHHHQHRKNNGWKDHNSTKDSSK